MGSVSSRSLSNCKFVLVHATGLSPLCQILFSLNMILLSGKLFQIIGLAHQQYGWSDSQLEYRYSWGSNFSDYIAWIRSLLGHSPHLALSCVSTLINLNPYFGAVHERICQNGCQGTPGGLRKCDSLSAQGEGGKDHVTITHFQLFTQFTVCHVLFYILSL